MRMDPGSVVDYAMPYGDANLRQQIQVRLGIVGIEADLSNIVVTNGASQALDLCGERGHFFLVALRRKQSMASSGRQTIGSFSLKLVLRMTGIRVLHSKARIKS